MLLVYGLVLHLFQMAYVDGRILLLFAKVNLLQIIRVAIQSYHNGIILSADYKVSV